jgi:segregation and condensation protein A
MLLPQYGEDGEPIESPEDPRKELVQKILEYQRYQDAGKKLYQRPLLARDVWARGIRENYLGDGDEGEIVLDEDGLFGLIASYRRAIKKMKKSVHQVRAKGQSIGGRILEVKDRLIVGLRVNMRDLLRELASDEPGYRKQLLITFLSMLELGRMGFVSLFQNEVYGDIYVEALRPIERNVLERVQEFDSSESEAVAARLIEDAFAQEGGAAPLALASAEGGSAVERPAEPGAPGELALFGPETLDDDLAVPANEVGVEAASDDEILLAEVADEPGGAEA